MGKQTVLNDVMNNFYMNDETLQYLRSDEDDPQVDFRGVKTVTVFGSDYIKRLFVIVETYDHKNYGRGKREFLAQFTPAERKLLSKWYLKIYAWYLRTGIPNTGVRMSVGTYNTLCKFADFFATI